jgi:hypothetical protein
MAIMLDAGSGASHNFRTRRGVAGTSRVIFIKVVSGLLLDRSGAGAKQIIGEMGTWNAPH